MSGPLSGMAAHRDKRNSGIPRQNSNRHLAIRNGCNSLKTQHGDTF